MDNLLTSYTDHVNDLKGINNYADNLKVLTSQLKEKNYSQWKSNLDQYEIDNLLQPLTCEKNCTNVGVTIEHISKLHEKKATENVYKKSNVVINPSKVSFFAEKNMIERAQHQSCIDRTDSSKGDYFANANKFVNNQYGASSTNNSRQEDSCAENQTNKFSMFKTAKKELYDQNIKKGNKTSGMDQQPSVNYGGQKRSLGARRGVQSKFIPPIKTDCSE